MSALIDERDESTPIDSILDLLIRHIKFSEVLYQHTFTLDQYLSVFNLVKYGQLAYQKLSDCVMTAEELKTAYSLEQEIEAYTTPKTDAERGFIEAIKKGDLAFVKKYLAEGGNPLLYSAHNTLTSTLHLAITYDHLAIFEILIKAYQQYGVNLDLRAIGSQYNFVLRYSIQQKKPNHTRALLQAGADPRHVPSQLRMADLQPQHRPPHMHYSNVEEFLASRTEKFSIAVLPIVKDKNGNPQLEYYALHDGSRPSLENIGRTTHKDFACFKRLILTQDAFIDVFENKFTYEFKTVNGYADEDMFQLTLASKLFNYSLDRNGSTYLYSCFPRVFHLAVGNYLHEKKLPFGNVTCNEYYATSFIMNFPRTYLPDILNFIFEFHEHHLCAVTSEIDLNKLAMLDSAFITPLERINAMTSHCAPNAEIPMLYDAGYLRMISPCISKEEREMYECYTELRLVAWVLSSMLFAKQINLTSDVLTYIAAFTHDNSVFNHTTAIDIVKPCFNRPITSTYTPRLFLPAAAPPASSLLVCTNEVCLNP